MTTAVALAYFAGFAGFVSTMAAFYRRPRIINVEEV